jgi:hypothetical protein
MMTVNGSQPQERPSTGAPFTLKEAGSNLADGNFAIDPQGRRDKAGHDLS